MDADHFQCGDTSLWREQQQQPVNTGATGLRIKRWQCQPVHL